MCARGARGAKGSDQEEGALKPGPWAEGGPGGVVHYRVGEGICGALCEGQEEPPYCLTMHCRIVQYRRLQLQCILHFP